jgi:hypothetical protein
MKTIAVVLGIWAALFGIGAWAGAHYSYDWENADVVRAWAAQRTTFNRAGGTDPAAGVFHFDCGPDRYSYSKGAAKFQMSVRTGYWQHMALRRSSLSAGDAAAVAGAFGVTFTALPKVFEALSALELRSGVAAAVAGGVVGAGWGFKSTYKPEPECNVVREALQDMRFWQSLEGPLGSLFGAIDNRPPALPSSTITGLDSNLDIGTIIQPQPVKFNLGELLKSDRVSPVNPQPGKYDLDKLLHTDASSLLKLQSPKPESSLLLKPDTPPSPPPVVIPQWWLRSRQGAPIGDSRSAAHP